MIRRRPHHDHRPPPRGGADPAVANEPGGPAGVLEHLIFLSDGVFAIARSTARMAISAARCAAIATGQTHDGPRARSGSPQRLQTGCESPRPASAGTDNEEARRT